MQYRGTGFHSWVRKIPWRRKWQPAPVFLPGKSPGQRRLAGYSPWGHKSQTQPSDFAAAAAAAVHRYQKGFEQSGRITQVTVKQYFSTWPKLTKDSCSRST